VASALKQAPAAAGSGRAVWGLYAQFYSRCQISRIPLGMEKQGCQVLKALQYYFAKFSSLLLVSGHEPIIQEPCA
jgi:hypothetical protein